MNAFFEKKKGGFDKYAVIYLLKRMFLIKKEVFYRMKMF